MGETFAILNDEHVAERDAFVERLLQSTSGVFDMFTIYIGDRLGLYRALAQNGPLTSVELAGRTRTHERYVREWLEQQTVAGILEVENPDAGPTARRFHISPARAEVLVARDSLNYLAPLAQLVAGVTRPVASVVEAPGLYLVGLVWISIHALLLLLVARLIKAPVFFLAVGSQANVGGAASAPIVASAFHPALAPVGVLVAVVGYALGTYGAWICGQLMRVVAPM